MHTFLLVSVVVILGSCFAAIMLGLLHAHFNKNTPVKKPKGKRIEISGRTPEQLIEELNRDYNNPQILWG